MRTLMEDVLTADVLRKLPEYRVLVDPSAIAAASWKFEDLIAVQTRVSTMPGRLRYATASTRNGRGWP